MAIDQGKGTEVRKRPSRAKKDPPPKPNPPRQKDQGQSSRAKKAKDKQVVVEEDPPIEEEEEEPPEFTTAPWPRDDGEAFTCGGLTSFGEKNVTMRSLKNDIRFRPRKPNAPWGFAESFFYNGWLRIGFRPTKVICPATLNNLGIHQDVVDMLGRMGLGTLPFRHYPLYKELARQFFSSVELRVRAGGHDDAHDAYLCWFARGVQYEISIPEICSLFGFDETKRGCHYPPHFPATLWCAIGDISGVSRERKLTLIRNPVIRVAAKIVGNLLLGKEETGSLTDGELVLIHYGLPRSIDDIYTRDDLRWIPRTLDTNLGYKFAEMLVGKKARGISIAKAKDEAIGNLLTPIFHKAGVDLDAEPTPDHGRAAFDWDYFKSALIVKRDSKTYQFTTRAGETRCVTLPVPGLTTPSTPDALYFHVPDDLLLDLGRGPRRRHAPAHEPPPPPAQYSSVEYTLPPDDGEYDVAPLPTDATMDQKLDRLLENQRRLMENQRRQQSMMRKMWDVMTRLVCGSGGASSSRAADETGPSGAASADDMMRDATEDEEEQTDDELVRHRPRREPGERESRSPDRF